MPKLAVESMHSINAEKRAVLGKKVKSLRAQGIIPAELYGHNFSNEHLSIREKDFTKVFKEVGESAIIQLHIVESQNDADTTQTNAEVSLRKSALSPRLRPATDGQARESALVNVLIQGVTHNPITDEITHIDFYQVRMDEKIEAEVPIRFVGEAPAVKEKNGIVVRAMQAIEVEALPGDLPHEIEVNLSPLVELGQSLYVRDIKPIAGVKLLVDPETVIVTVTEPAKEEEVPQGPQSVEEVKVEGAEKKAQKETEGKVPSTEERVPSNKK